MSQDRRRSSRISDKQSQIPLVEILDSSDEDQGPLPIQQQLISIDSESDQSPPQIECVLPPTPRPASTQPAERRSPFESPKQSRAQSQPNLSTRAHDSPLSKVQNRSLGKKVVKKNPRTPKSAAKLKKLKSPKTKTPTPQGSQASRNRLSSSSSDDSDSPISPRSTAKESANLQVMSVENQTPPPKTTTTTTSVPLQQTMTDQEMIERARARRLVVEEIVGAVNDQGVELVVKWKGIDDLERIPMKHMRVLFPQHVVEFLCSKIKWTNDYRKVSLSQES